MTTIAPQSVAESSSTVSTFACDIPASKQAEVVSTLTALLKKSARAGLPFAWTFGKAFWKSVQVRKETGERVSRDVDIFCVPLEVSGDMRLALPGGWTLVGSIAMIDGVLVTTGDVPQSARATWQRCDHCQSVRNRTKTFMVLNSEGKTLMVGSSCMEDFLGRDVFRAIAGLALWDAIIVSTECDEDDDGFGGGGGDRARFPLEGLVALSYAVVSEYGFVSKAKADLEAGIASTSIRVGLILSKRSERPEVKPEHTARAIAAIEWVESLSDSECEANSYLANLREIARSNMASYRLLGLAVSICKAYDVAMERAHTALEALTAPRSQYLGTIGERQSFVVSCTHMSRPFDTGFGWSQFYTFKTAKGEILTWKTAAGIKGFDGQELTVSPVEFTITGRVERHEVGRYSNQMETNLSRAKLSPVGVAAAPKKRAAKKVA